LPQWIAVVLLVAILVVLVVVGVPVYKFIKQFNDAVDVLTNMYGVNTFLAKALSAVLFTPVVVGLGRGLLGLWKSGFRGAMATGLYAAAYFLGMYAVSRSASFAHATGEGLQWYAETPEGLRFYDSPGYDTKYGLPLRPVTPEMKVAQARRQLGQVPQPVPVARLSELELFDRLTGNPRYWYFRSPSGDFELFDGPGFHPQYQQLLRPLTTEVASEAAQWLRDEEAATTREEAAAFRNRYVDPAITRVAGARQWAILITDGDNNSVSSLTSAATEVMSGRGVRLVSLFRSSLLRDRLNQNLYDGDPALIQKLGLSTACDAMALGVLKVDVAASSDVQGMMTARSSLRFRVVSSTNGSVADEFEVTSIGAGFSEAAARTQAIDRLATAFKSRLVQSPT
jgi:hypothetical protein